MKKPKLKVYAVRRVNLHPSSIAWVMLDGKRGVLFQYLVTEHKRQFVARCAAWCRANGTATEPISLRIFTGDGSRVIEERTYPRSADPRRSKG